jgi:hypothetical protein
MGGRVLVRGVTYTGIWWGSLRVSDHLGERGVDGRMILRCIFRKWGTGLWTGLSWRKIGTGGEHFEFGNVPAGSIKCEEFFDL